MSATIAHKQFVDFFGGESVCSVVKVPGRSHPVDLYYTPAPEPDFLEAALIAIMQIHQEREKGDILVFLPGQEDIEGLVSILNDKRKLLAQHTRKDGSALDDLLIAPIFAALPFEQQIAVFNPAPARTRKVVIGTNIAETSITINGIRYVIDAGFVKLKVCHPATGVEILKLSGTSRASADQRSGRAGREAPGEAYRLYEEAEYAKMLAQTPPEIVRVEMASVYLQLKSLGIDVDTFPFMDSPNPQHLKKSALLLLRLGALNREKQLTELGKKLAVLPLHPLYGRALLVSQEFECVSEMLSIVAMLSSDSIFYQSKSQKPEMVAARSALQHSDGDHLTLLRIYKQWSQLPEGKRRNFCMEVGLNMHSMKRAHDIRKQLKDLLPQVGIKHVTSVGGVENWSRVRQCLLKGCFVNIAKLDEVGGTTYMTMNSRQQAKIHPHSGLFARRPLPACIMYSELVTTSQNYLRTVTEIEPAWLLTLVPTYFAKDVN
jgi:HrpA-like RNA helicase